ncbi:unnamed protein product, partial [marine sediment metagenome]
PSIGIETVEVALFTHHHRDQCQGAQRLAEQGCKLIVPEYEKPLFADVENFWTNRHIYDSYNDRSTVNSMIQNVPVDGVLSDYSPFLWQEYSFEILPTPGHTLGSISLVTKIDGQKCIFCGDLVREGGRLHNLYDLQLSYNGWEGVDQLFMSALSLERENATAIYPSHGKIIRDPGNALHLLKKNLDEWYQWCIKGQLSIFEKDIYPFGNPRLPSEFTPHQITEHLIGFPNACCTFYAIIADSGEALFIDYGAAGWSHFSSYTAFRESWELQRLWHTVFTS